MISIKPFAETDKEFNEICRVENLMRFDNVSTPKEMKRWWNNRNKNRISKKLLLYKNYKLIGVLHYTQGLKENKKNCYFGIYLDPVFSNNGYQKQLYDKMLQEVKKFNCTKLFPSSFEHSNYDNYSQFLIKTEFKIVARNREYSLKIKNINLKKYLPLIKKLESKGIKFYDSKHEMLDFPNHYKKLEQLEWEYGQDLPRPEGIVPTRWPFKEFMKQIKVFYEYDYGVDLVAVKNQQYIGGTYLFILQGTPEKAWTGALGVLRKFRRQGIATALKIKAIEILRDKGIKEIRTDNEENNPMYKINVALGFKPVPFSLDYSKDI